MSNEAIIDFVGDEDAAAQTSAPVAVVDEARPPAVALVDERADFGDPLPEAATLNDDGSITLALRREVTIVHKSERGERKQVLNELTFHRLTGADMRAISAVSGVHAQIVMFAKSARLRDVVMSKVFDVMDGADILDAAACVERFFGNGRKTGR